MPKRQGETESSDHLEAHCVLEEDIVILADSKVVGVKESILHGECLPCNLLPLWVILVDFNLHLCACDWLDVTASTKPNMW